MNKWFTILISLTFWAGQEVSAMEKSIGAKANWLGSKAGITDKVLAPWTPIKVQTAGKDVTVRPWGRAYEFRQLPFPIQIETAGKSLLSGPIRLVARANGQQVSWSQVSLTVAEKTDALVRLSSKASEKSLGLSADVAVEYDGLIRMDLKLEPCEKLLVDQLTFEIPLRAEHARYLYTFSPRSGAGALQRSMVGALPNDGFRGRFIPFFWLGDEERGLSWFCESDENWNTSEADRATEIVHEGEQVVARLNLITKPTELSPDTDPRRLTYTFGLQPTPVKPVVKDAWDYRFIHVEATYFGIQTRLKLSEATLEQLSSAGVKTLALHEHWTDIQSYYTTDYGEDLKKLVKRSHDRGMQVLLYFGFLISDLAPEWSEFGEQCIVMPRGGYEPYNYPPQPKQNAYRVCYNSVWQDRLASGIAEAMDEYDADGVYLDGTEFVWPCSNRLHGCGYVRPDGSIAPTYPFWAVRSMMKRIYAIVKSRKPDGQVNVHNSTCMTIPTLGWATSYWDGEQFRDLPPASSKTEILSLDSFRTEFMGHQWGVPAEFLSYEGTEDKKIFVYNQAYAFTLLHDVLTRSWKIGPSLTLASSLWNLSDRFGRKEAQWLPYWRNAKYVVVQPIGAYASLYRHPKNGVLAVVSNLAKSKSNVAVQLDLKNLGLNGNVSAQDALTDETVDIRDGGVSLQLDSLQWKIIWLKRAT